MKNIQQEEHSNEEIIDIRYERVQPKKFNFFPPSGNYIDGSV
jgi:hypothetical protein